MVRAVDGHTVENDRRTKDTVMASRSLLFGSVNATGRCCVAGCDYSQSAVSFFAIFVENEAESNPLVRASESHQVVWFERVK